MLRSVGPCPATIMIVGEAPSEQDVRENTPFAGGTGLELGKMLAEAGITRNQCFITHVVRVRPPSGDMTYFIPEKKKEITSQHLLVGDRMCLPVVKEGIELLQREIELCRPSVIIACGNVALWALTGNWGIMKWRGSVLQCGLPLGLDYAPKVVPVYAPSTVMRQWSWRPITVHDLRRAKRESADKSYHAPVQDFTVRPTFEQVISVLNTLIARADETLLELSTDVETRSGHIACIGFAWNTVQAICIPIMCAERDSGYWTLEEEVAIILLVRRLMTHPNVKIVGQNFLYDAQYFDHDYLFLPHSVQDTMLAQHSMFSNMQKSLDFTSSIYCEHYTYWKDEGKEWDAKTGEDQLWIYNCKDSVNTLEVHWGQQKAVDAMNLRPVHDFQQSLFFPVLRTMLRGIRVDRQKRADYAILLTEEIAKREQWLIDIFGHPVNYRSPAQMQALFYNDLRQWQNFNRKTGTVTCDDEALGTIAGREPILQPVIKKIQECRSLSVFLSTFVNAPLSADDRMRCSFNIAGTETYRFSSSQNAFGSGMNLQNIPKGGGDDNFELPNIRELFIPDPGMTFFDIDLSSADLRIVVWESDETELKAMLAAGLDPYTEVAKEFYHDPTLTKSDPRRQLFKSFCHGTNYLGTAAGLAERLGLLVREAERTQRWYFGKFPRIERWQKDLKDQVVNRKFVQNAFGYRQYFFDRIEGTVFNQAAAWIPQSTVACLINRAYVAIDAALPEVEILLQVHDSLAGQFPTKHAELCLKRILELSTINVPYDDPLVIPVGAKTSEKSWGDCE